MPHLLTQLSPKYKIPAMPLTLPVAVQEYMHLSYDDDGLEDKRETYQNCTVLCCVWQLCTVIGTHSWAVVTVNCLLRFRLGLHFVCFSVLINVIVFFYAFVVLVLLWSPYGIGQTHYIFALWFLLLLSFLSSQYGKLRPTSSWDRFVSLGHPI